MHVSRIYVSRIDMVYSVRMSSDIESTFSQLYAEQEWPVCGIRNFQKINETKWWEIEFSRYDRNYNYVGHLFKKEEFFQWFKEDDLAPNIKQLTEFYGICSDFSFDEHARANIMGQDLSETKDPCVRYFGNDE